MSTAIPIPRRTRTLRLVAAAALALGALTGCGASASTENADGTTTVRYQSYPGSVDLLELADALGELDGITLKKVGDVQGGPASLQALASNQIDISNNAFFGATAQVVASGAPIKAVIASYGTNEDTGSGVVALPDSGLTEDPHSFIGKKVAVNTLGANAEAVLDTWFAKGGLSQEEIDQITLVPLPPLNTLQALKEGQVDAAYLALAQVRANEDAVKLKTVVKDSDIVGFYNGGGLSLRTEWIEEKPQVSRTLVAGVAAAIDYIESHERQETLDLYVPWLEEHGYADSVEAVEKNWAGSTGVSSKGGVISDDDISLWLDWLSSRGDVDPDDIEPGDVYTNELNPNA